MKRVLLDLVSGLNSSFMTPTNVSMIYTVTVL